MSLQHREDKRFSKKEPAMRTELAMAGSPVMIRAVRPDGGQEMQMGSTSDMEPASVERMLDYLSPTRLLNMDKADFEQRAWRGRRQWTACDGGRIPKRRNH